jgi:hypothetical protein
MMPDELARKLGWVPYVLDFSFEQSLQFAAAVATATQFDDLPQWVKDAADAADRQVGVPTRHAHIHRNSPGDVATSAR